MKRHISLAAGALCAAVLLALAACGGGGGGFTPITYAGLDTLVTIDDTNAADFAAMAQTGSSLGMAAPLPLGMAGGSVTTTEPAPILDTITQLSRKLPDYLKNAPRTDDTAAKVTITDSGSCWISGSMSITASWNPDTGDLFGTLSFAACDDGGGTVLNGSVTMSMSGIPVDAFGDPDFASLTSLTVTETLKNLSVTFQDSGETITVYSVITLFEDMSGDPTVSMTISDMIMQESVSGLTARIKNYVMTVVDFGTYSSITISSAGSPAEIYDSTRGFVYIYTATPILDDGFAPYQGVVHMDGDNGSWAEVDFSITCDAVTDNGSYFDGAVSGTFCYMPL